MMIWLSRDRALRRKKKPKNSRPVFFTVVERWDKLFFFVARVLKKMGLGMQLALLRRQFVSPSWYLPKNILPTS